MAERECSSTGCTKESCEGCPGKQQSPQSRLEAQHAYSNIRHVIGVVSGKGGVGKSLVTSMMAVKMNGNGYKTAILDADITGPSIPKAFGISGDIGLTD